MKSIPLLSVIVLTLSIAAAAPTTRWAQHVEPNEVPQGITASDWEKIRKACEAGEHRFQPAGSHWQAYNPGQRWNTTFDRRGFVAEPESGGWQWGLELQSYGFAGQESSVDGESTARVDGQRLSYSRDSLLEEWFINDQRGLEHGFTISRRPVGDFQSDLAFNLAVRGGLRPVVSANGINISFQDDKGAAVLNYSGLKVWDADGKDLRSRFVAAGDEVRLLVDERGARYPVTVDPIAQQAYLKAGNTGANDRLGWSVAISGETVVVGAPYEDSNATGINGDQADNTATDSGAVYVFVRNGAAWTQQAYLKASNTQAGDWFGRSVAISGDTLVVGAPLESSNATGVNGNQSDNTSTSAGAAYVFTRSGTAWSQQAYLKASNTGINDSFGLAVAISGDTVVVASPSEDSNATGVNGDGANNSAGDSGAAYVFTRVGSNWTQRAYLKAANSGVGDNFGLSVGIDGNTAIVGAPSEDGAATGVNGNAANDLAAYAGAAYVFVRNANAWSQQAYLKASNTGEGDNFGYAVAISGETLAVGAPSEGSNATGVNGNQSNDDALASGATYVFHRSGVIWTQQAYLKAGNAAQDDYFGSSVGLSGVTLVIGAPFESGTAVESGAAYVFVRGGTVWSQDAHLKASNLGANDQFGSSVAVSGETVAVGAIFESSNSTGINGSSSNNLAPNSGATYVFTGGGLPDIAIEQPGGAPVANGASKTVIALPGGISEALFTLRNTGNRRLYLTGNPDPVLLTGNSDFTVTAQPAGSLGSGVSTSFTLRFAPATGGLKSATLSIPSDDPDESPYIIHLTGNALTTTLDSDGDGLNDAAEYQLATLGFDWQTAQPALVSSFLASNGLYTLQQVRTLNVSVPLIERNPATGAFTLTLGLEKSTNLGTFIPFPMTAPQTAINGAGKLEFQFNAPDDSAFFRVEAK